MTDLYLASASPRRAELLAQIGVSYEVVLAPIDETRLPEETPAAYVQRIALEKAQAGKAYLSDVSIPVLGSDTSVVLGNEALGKPENEGHALEMLRAMSGRQHSVMTAVALLGQHTQVILSTSKVWFRDLSDDEIKAYWQTGEPVDKAGAYAVQGLAAAFIERIDGSYSGIMGLPLFETTQLLKTEGINVF